MTSLILLGVAVAVVAAIIVHLRQSRNRYTRMTEEEFEAEAKRASTLGAAMLTTHQILTPHHRVEYLLQEDKHAEAEQSDSGDGPEAGVAPQRPA
jgi:hypothetical protein